ncbi:glycosyltransferase family 39 protein [Rubripirellula amarantea]|nr:glycosyltransferase family 39 protein [Rubripirellula amarantea]
MSLFIASSLVMLPNLSYPLMDPDETRYAQIALEMVQSRDWITPTLQGDAYLDKPPLMYWLTAASFNLWGQSETAARLPSVIAALTTVMLTFVLGRRLVGSRAAWLGSCALILCGGFVLAGRFLILDSMLSLFVLTCLLTGYIAVRESNHRWAWWIASGVACALGVLTKGPVALVLCAPPLVMSGWLRNDQTRVRLFHWAAFAVPMALVCVPWYVAVWKLNSNFGDYFFLEHNLKRFTEGSNHEQPFWFYLPVLFAGMFPASLLLPSLAVFLVSRSDRKRLLRSQDLGFVFCSSVWILFFFSIARCKLPTYILPAIPLICLLLGSMLHHTVFNSKLQNRITQFLKPFPKRSNLILVVACLIILGVDFWLTNQGLSGRVSGVSMAVLLVCIVIVLTTVARWKRSDCETHRSWAMTALIAVALLAFSASWFLPRLATRLSVYAHTEKIIEQSPGTPIVFYGERPHAASLRMSSDGVVYFPLERDADFAYFVKSHGQVLVIMHRSQVAETSCMIQATHQLSSTGTHRHLFWAKPLPYVAKQTAGTDSAEIR